MWEGEPVGVDQKRPLAGFALVAVLCAVLMTLSVSRGWGLDLIHPGRPIVSAGQVEKSPHDRQQPAPTGGSAAASVPAELSPQPLGVATGAVAHAARSHARPVRAAGRSVSVVRSTGGDEQAEAEPEAEPAAAADPRAERRAEREAAKAARKADREAAKAARKAEHEAAKATRHAEHEAAKAARHAEHEAAKATRQAEHDAARAARDAEREAAEAVRQAEQDAARAARDAEQEAAQAARDAAKAARHP